MYGRTDIHDEQRSGWPLDLAKTIAKVEQEQVMLEVWHETVRELCEWIPEVIKSMIGNVAGEFHDKGIRKCHSTCKSGSITTVNTLKNC